MEEVYGLGPRLNKKEKKKKMSGTSAPISLPPNCGRQCDQPLMFLLLGFPAMMDIALKL